MYCIDVKNNQVEGKASLSISLPVNHLASSLDNAKLVVATETVIILPNIYTCIIVLMLGICLHC